PEIGMLTLKLRLGPCKPDPVMMIVIRRIIVGDHCSLWSKDGMNIGATQKHWLDIRRGQTRRLSHKAEHLAITSFDLEAVLNSCQVDAGASRRLCRTINQPKRF